MRTLQKCGAGIISYVICGVISGRPGMTVNAIAYKSGMADDEPVAAMYP